MKKNVTNVSASILARLKKISEKENIDFNFLLLRYIQERLLFRLAASEYANKFVLKGGLLLLAYSVEKARPTKDIDFLGVNVSNDRKELERIVREIVLIKLNDGITFAGDSVESEEIKDEADYPGVRVKLTAEIGAARNKIRIDFGFGDVMTPPPLLMDYPTLLGTEDVKVLAYSKETIVAEKFEAIVKLSIFNSRMKDFFDLVFLSHEFDFNGQLLQSAIRNTFRQRQTSLESAETLLKSNLGEQANFQRLWEAFKKRTRLASPMGFKDAFFEILVFLKPIVEAERGGKILKVMWKQKVGKWEEIFRSV